MLNEVQKYCKVLDSATVARPGSTLYFNLLIFISASYALERFVKEILRKLNFP